MSSALVMRCQLVAALDRLDPDDAEAAGIDLPLAHVRLQRRPFLGHEDVRPGPLAGGDRHGAGHGGHLADVFGLALVELLAVGVAGLGGGEHDDPGQRPIDAGLPRSVRRRDLAVLVLGRLLAQVPDVALRVLAVPVERVLDQGAVLEDAVADDRRRDAHDHLRLGEHLDLDVLVAVEDERRPDLHREERVIDARHEVGRVDHGGEGRALKVGRRVAWRLRRRDRRRRRGRREGRWRAGGGRRGGGCARADGLRGAAGGDAQQHRRNERSSSN